MSWLRRGAVFALVTALSGSCGMPVRIGTEPVRAAPVPRTATAPESQIHVSAPRPPPTPQRSAPRPQLAQAPMPPAPQAATAAVVYHPGVPQPSRADEVVGIRLQAEGPGRRQIITFGQVFAPGQVPRGMTVVAEAGGVDVPTQFDVKTAHPDGSARMGVVTLHAIAPATAMLRRVLARPAGAVVSLGDLYGRHDLRVRLVLHGPAGPEPHDLDIAALLDRALREGRVSYWLRGPLATEGRFSLPIAGSLRLIADVRALADRSTRTDLQFANDIAMQPGGGALTYDVTIQADGRTVVEQAGVRHFQYQVWHREVWSPQPPSIHVVHDTAALARAGVVQAYDLTTGVDPALLARHGGADGVILGAAGLTRYMPTTGGRPDIGPTTQANTVWLMTQHPAAERIALAQADAAGSVPWNYHDPATSSALSPARHPALWIDYRGGRWGTVALTQPPDYEGSGWTPDNAHQPDLSFVPYVLTGARYRWDRLEAQALFSIFSQDPRYRGFEKGIVVNPVEQVRGRAWAFRAVDQAAFIAPDDAPLRDYFRSVQRHCIAFLQQERAWRAVGEAQGTFGEPAQDHPRPGGTAPWQQDFLVSMLAMSARRGTEGAADLVSWMTGFVAGRFTAGDRGFRPNNGTAFGLLLFERNPRAPWLTWREVEAANIAAGLAKDGPDLASTDENTMRIARGALAGIISATGSAQAAQALAWVEANLPGVTPAAFRRDPTWNIVPLRSPGRAP